MNKMIEKSVSIFLVLIMFLSVFGCAKQNETPETTSDTTTMDAPVEATTKAHAETTTEKLTKSPEPTLNKDAVISEYRKIMSKYDQTDTYTTYSLYDIDKNELPELFVWYNDMSTHNEIVDIYSFINKSAFKLTTIKHYVFNIATIPDENGIMIFGYDDISNYECKDSAYILSLENEDNIKKESILDKNNCLTIGEKTFHQFTVMENINDGSDPSDFIEGSEWVDYYSVNDLFMLNVCFDKYTNEKPAYKKIIENYRNKSQHDDSETKYTGYSLYDIDNNGITELILMYKDEYNNLCGSIYTILDNRIKYCDYLYTDDTFYEGIRNDGILCKVVARDGTYIAFDVYELKNGHFPDYPKSCLYAQYEVFNDELCQHESFYYYDSPIDEAEFLAQKSQLKEIKTYNMDDLSALDLL